MKNLISYRIKSGLLSLIVVLMFFTNVNGQSLKMPHIFGSGMVLQQDTQVPIWGWAKPGSKIEVTASWGKKAETLCDNSGKWKTAINTPKAIAGKAPTYTLAVKDAGNSINFENILIGEVWVCSGQSNMEFSMKPSAGKLGTVDYETEIANANFKNIRLFNVKKDSADVPKFDCKGIWEPTTPGRVASFSAVGYYFGKTLYQKLNIPIGLIQDAFSGSGIQCWLKKDLIDSNSNLKEGFSNDPIKNIAHKPSVFYNAMISPIIPFAIKGVLWYQGETNVGKSDLYAESNILMIEDWRKDWGRDFSFYAVQMTPRFYKDKEKNDISFNRGYFREAQSKIMQLPKTGIVVTSDLMLNADERSDTHPRNKKDIGLRLAFWALAKDYGQQIQYIGPVYSSFTTKGKEAIVSFEKASIGSGLMTKDGAAVKCFKIAGEDGKFYSAVAVIKGDKVIVSSPKVDRPVSVRYAFTDGALSNLQNKEGLAAYPFRTDKLKIPKAVDMEDDVK